MRPWLALAGGLAASCVSAARQPNHPADSAAATAVETKDSPPADSLVLKTTDGHEIWLAEGRTARDSAGRPCYERSVEIRREGSRIKVPLLFVTRRPTALDAGHVSAELSLDCRPLALYRVELATGRPTKIEDRR